MLRRLVTLGAALGGVALALGVVLVLLIAGVIVPNSDDIFVDAKWRGLPPSTEPTAEIVFTGDARDGTVTMIDGRTSRRIGQINVIPDGTIPHDWQHGTVHPAVRALQGVNYAQHLAVHGRTLLVARGYLADVAAFDLPTGELRWRIPIPGLRADHMQLTRDGSRLFVSATTADQVIVIDPRQPRVIGSIETGTYAHGSELSHDGTQLYVGSLSNLTLPSWASGDSALTVADTATLQTRRTLALDRGVRPFQLSHDGASVFLQLSQYHGISQVDVGSGREIDRVDLPVPDKVRGIDPDDYPNDAAHHGLALSGDGETLCAAATVSDYVALVSARGLDAKAILPVATEPGWAATSADGTKCYVTSRGTNTLTIIDYASAKVVATVPVGGGPQHVVSAQVPESALPPQGPPT